MAEREDEEKKPFIVKDRRRFDASGNRRDTDENGDRSAERSAKRPEPPRAQAQRPPQQAQPQAQRAQPQQPQSPPPQSARSRAPEPPHVPDEYRSEWESAQQEAKDAMDAAAGDYPRGPVAFSELVLSIATNAVLHLGMDTKDGRVPPRVNLTLAAQHIDIIGMLAEKTKGNLDREEQELLDSLLYDLRMKYVAVAQAQSRGR